MYLLFARKKVSIGTCHLLDCISMASLKPTIDYNNILIKAQFINIVAVSDNGTHSERLACLKILKGTIQYLHSLVLISGSLLRLVIVKMFCCQKGFPETPETPPLYALVCHIIIMLQCINMSAHIV